MAKMKAQSNSKNFLADKIAGILNTAPSSFDPEDDAVDATSAQVLNEEIEEFEEDEAILSKFRRANVDLLADVDEKYAGKKTSRKNLRDSDSEESINSEEESDEDVDEAGSSMEGSLVEGEKLSAGEATSDEDEDEDDEENGSSGDDDEEATSLNDFSEEEDQNFKHMSETNVSNQIKKGLCVRNQMAKWENLLEMRIQLQKCLLTANKMPQPATFAEMKKEPEFSNKVDETRTMLGATLDKFLLLQKLMEKQFPETKNLGQQAKKTDGEDDEEIPSDTENEESASEEEEEKEEKVESSSRKGKKRKLEEYEKDISEHHKRYKDYRNNVVQKWNDKTRVVVKGDATSHSILDQIEYNLSNKDKLIQRTQTKRSQYTILGEESNEVESSTEIFDDDDFYHQLLRELIEVKSADVTDPVQLGRQWIQLQNMRSKMKRKVDTKATKGRRIRYAVHSKLVNFMAAMEERPWTDEARNELYSSLFGKK